jgi:hypothetical protein
MEYLLNGPCPLPKLFKSAPVCGPRTANAPSNFRRAGDFSAKNVSSGSHFGISDIVEPGKLSLDMAPCLKDWENPASQKKRRENPPVPANQSQSIPKKVPNRDLSLESVRKHPCSPIPLDF